MLCDRGNGGAMSPGFILAAIALTLGTIIGSVIAVAILSWAWRTIRARPEEPPIDWDRYGGPTSGAPSFHFSTKHRNHECSNEQDEQETWVADRCLG
jgi:hypothetical protein